MDSLLTDEEIDAIEEDTTGNAIHILDSVPFARAIEAAVIAKLKEWQPIETAPASAEYVLSLNASGRMKIETGHWLRNMLHASKIDEEECYYTHWMPLPKPPTDQEKRNG